MVARNSAYSTPWMTRSSSPNRMAVECEPIFRSSSRSTMAYQVSYAVDHRMLPAYSSQASIGTSPCTAAKAIGMPQPKDMPR